MILYLDSSALVKRYVAELGSSVVSEAISQAAIIATGLISRAEVAAALAKAMHVGTLTKEEAQESLQTFRSDWPDLMRVRVTEAVVARADALAWEWGLRGYDAVQLAAAIHWQEALGETVTLATFDRQLWAVAEQMGLIPYPPNLPMLLEEWKGHQ